MSMTGLQLLLAKDTVHHKAKCQGKLEPLEGPGRWEREDEGGRSEQGWVALAVVGGVGRHC